ncbi:MAG: hypothetical protein RIE77_03050 [Phycisphaerales bacterium]|jgi:hypothetical protein
MPAAMTCCHAAPPPLPAEAAQTTDVPRDAKRRGRCQAMTASPGRAMMIVMTLATALATVVAIGQLAEGGSGEQAGETLFVVSAFNLVFTALFAPLVAIFTLRAGFCRAIRAFFGTIFTGIGLTLGLLFMSVVILFGLAAIFG